ncbi:MAG TPA: GIY-YIG nuclease family protein [Longimicrobium sp.]|nr:GIY-YIG nuclease family protein [Longimicrobium sp.]
MQISQALLPSDRAMGADRYWVYILSNASRTLYIGVTNDLVRRVWQHKQKAKTGFTAQFNVTQLVYFEEAAHPQVAIAREKELKGWRRARKIALGSAANPTWRDLSEDEGFFSPIR